MPNIIKYSSYCSSEILYFCGLISYMLLCLQYETLWEYPEVITVLLFWISLITLIIHLCSIFHNYKKAYELLFLLLSAILSIVVGINAGFSNNKNLLSTLILSYLIIFGAKGINYNKIIKIYLIVGVSYCTITILSSLIGFIDNITESYIDRESALGATNNLTRMCFGYNWSTNMANHVYFLILVLLYSLRFELCKKLILFLFLISLLILYFTGSRLSSYCIIMSILFTLVYSTTRGYVVLNNKHLKKMIVWCIPFFCIMAYIVTELYDDTNIIWVAIDILLTGRLGFGKEAFGSVGIPLFGQYYQMYGSARDDGYLYNYIDSSYIQLLVIYGFFYTLFIVGCFYLICRRAYFRNDVSLLYSILFAGFTGLICQHLIELYMNPFIIALFAKHNNTQS